MNSKKNKKGTVDSNFGLPPSLMSRFDLVLQLTKQSDLSHHKRIAAHILQDEELLQPMWNNCHLQSHIILAKSLAVVLSNEVRELLMCYYTFCTRSSIALESRTTLRLWGSLQRLTKCHAKLLIRTRTEIIDAVAVIMIFESSWGLERLIGELNVMQAMNLIGPSDEYIAAVVKKLADFKKV